MLTEETRDPPLEFLDAADCVRMDYKLPDMTGSEFLEGLAGGEADAHEYVTRRNLIRSLKAERDRLAGLLEEKEVLLKEVHHRVKNNLAVIASLLSLQAGQSTNEEVASSLRASQHRVESMALIHEQLYATDDQGRVDLAKHATMLARALFLTYGIDPARITFQVSMEPIQLDLNQAIPVGLILGELVANALKHAFPGGRTGSIAIGGACRNGRIELTVTDDGIGVPAGDDLEGRKSLGMQIVKILTRQLKGAFEVTSGRPAIFKISIPETLSGQQIVQSADSGG